MELKIQKPNVSRHDFNFTVAGVGSNTVYTYLSDSTGGTVCWKDKNGRTRTASCSHRGAFRMINIKHWEVFHVA